ncbi:Rgg/GadR/MutR family transcriptional regulator [Streptococcus ratti]|uniref:Rgg/GadR/MutR family transcriptional regulator n=1 Tax=Streptococcus ratti TaxID=1341 RepID=UPI0012450FAD|nr:Rgg/GadR/MutR family transcriptional regulator [Streptococcus ratti]QEY06923.1 helix-turn-helix domain-containing protein [Streptococcus ratti]
MDQEQLMQLGELYRDLRIARGLKLKDVARENLSLSQLSRFENGQTMLTADKLLLAIEAIHMTFPEFSYAVNHYQETIYFKRSQQLAQLYNQHDIDGLKTMLEDIEGDEVFDVYEKLNKLVVKVALFNLDKSYQVPDDDKKLLVNYLYAIEEWTTYELYIFGNTMTALSNEDLIFLGKAFIERDKLYSSIPTHKLLSQQTFQNLSLVLLERREFYYTRYFISHLRQLITFQDIFTKINIDFYEKLLDHMETGATTMADLEQFIDRVKELADPIFPMFLRENLRQILEV